MSRDYRPINPQFQIPPVGLSNSLSNSCWLNSLTQLLLSIPSFNQIICERVATKNVSNHLMIFWTDILKQAKLQDGPNRIVNTQKFIDALFKIARSKDITLEMLGQQEGVNSTLVPVLDCFDDSELMRLFSLRYDRYARCCDCQANVKIVQKHHICLHLPTERFINRPADRKTMASFIEDMMNHTDVTTGFSCIDCRKKFYLNFIHNTLCMVCKLPVIEWLKTIVDAESDIDKGVLSNACTEDIIAPKMAKLMLKNMIATHPQIKLCEPCFKNGIVEYTRRENSLSYQRNSMQMIREVIMLQYSPTHGERWFPTELRFPSHNDGVLTYQLQAQEIFHGMFDPRTTHSAGHHYAICRRNDGLLYRCDGTAASQINDFVTANTFLLVYHLVKDNLNPTSISHPIISSVDNFLNTLFKKREPNTPPPKQDNPTNPEPPKHDTPTNPLQ